MKNHTITVVVPCYNVERTLEQCVDSILNQSEKCFKIILVNDGSKDNTGIIAKRYADEYPEIITFIDQKNKGLGAARNAGLEKVETDYVTFLDSDDWLMPKYMEVINSRIEKSREKPDLIFTLPVIYNASNGLYEDWMDKPLFNEIFSKPSTVIHPKVDKRIFELEPNACRRVYSTKFLKTQDFRFPEGTKWEDVEPHFQLLYHAENCIGEKRVGFYYRVNAGGQITASGGRDRLQVVSVFGRTLLYALENDWSAEYVSYILRMLLSFGKWSLDVISIHLRKEFLHDLHMLYLSVPEKYLKTYFKLQHVSRRDKLLIKILRSNFYTILSNPFTYKNGKKVLGKVKRIIRR